MSTDQKSSWKTETKSAAKRILVGAVTAVCATATIYFLGFNRPKKKADELEVKKNTIQVWKDYLKLENKLTPDHDSSFARFMREEITLEQHRKQDSSISANFIIAIKELGQRPDIDADMKSLFGSRVEFKQAELDRFLHYVDRFTALRDTLIAAEYRNFLVNDLNEQFVGVRDNAVERMGRTIEDLLQFLQKKYKYPFNMSDINWYERYLQLKTIRNAELKPDNALPGS